MANRVTPLTQIESLSGNISASTYFDNNIGPVFNAVNDSSLGFNNYIGTDTGSANNYLISCTLGTPSGYNVGMTVTFKPASTNTGASTINVNSIASAAIQHGDGTACIGGEIQAGKNITLIYNGTAFQIQGPPFLYGTTVYYDYDDFSSYPTGSTLSSGNPIVASKLFVISGAGTGFSGASIVSAGHLGVYQLTSGTTLNQTVRAFNAGSISMDAFTYTLRGIMQTPGTIDSSQIFFGFLNAFGSPLNGASSVAIGFYGTNTSGFWQMFTSNGTSGTGSPTTQTISAATWYDLMIVANASGATFYVNGTQVGTQAVTYPSSSQAMDFGWMLNSSGTARTMLVDTGEILVTGIPILSGSTLPRFLHGLV